MKTFKLIFLATAMLLCGCSGGDDGQSDNDPGGKLNPYKVEVVVTRNSTVVYESATIVTQMCNDRSATYTADVQVDGGTRNIAFTGWGPGTTFNTWSVGIKSEYIQSGTDWIYLESGALTFEYDPNYEDKVLEEFEWYDSKNSVYYVITARLQATTGGRELGGTFNRTGSATIEGTNLHDIIGETPTTTHSQDASVGSGTYDSRTDFTDVLNTVSAKYFL